MAISDNHCEKSERTRMTWLPHPAALILAWMCLTIAMQPMHAPALLLSGSMVVAAALKLSAGRFVILLRRTRWIMLSLLLIYGYATAGTAVWPQGGLLSPTREGLLDGLLQLSRLVFALAGLSIVLGVLSREQLVGGLYALAWPLRFIGVSRERIAVRLALTLHYAESAMLDTSSDWRGSITRMLQPVVSEQNDIELHSAPFTSRDGLLVAAAAAVLAVVLL
jgi:energy-coupling factor transporter transmembrane protein EcfT